MGEPESHLQARTNAERRFESVLSDSLRDHRITNITEARSIVRIGKQVRVYEVVLERNGDIETRRFVAKEHPDASSAASSLAHLARLRRHGFAPPARYRVPEPVASSANLSIEAELDGAPWFDDVVGAASDAADWLLALQRAPVIAEVTPQGVVRARHVLWEPIADTVNRQLPSDRDAAVPSHGDFHPKNVRIGPGYVAAIDLLDLALREPAVDVGSAIAQLLVMCEERDQGLNAASLFWEHYRSRGSASPPRVCLFAARGLLETINYKLLLAQAEGDPEPPHSQFAELASSFLDAEDPFDVLA